MIKLFARRVVNSLLKLHVTNNKNSSRNFAQSQIFYEFLGDHQNVMRLFQIAWQKLKHTRWELNHGRCISELSTLSAKLFFLLTLETTNSLTKAPGLFGQPAADRKATLIVCPMSVLSNWTVSVHMIFLRRFCIISGLTFTNRKLEQPYVTFDDFHGSVARGFSGVSPQVPRVGSWAQLLWTGFWYKSLNVQCTAPSHSFIPLKLWEP